MSFRRWLLLLLALPFPDLIRAGKRIAQALSIMVTSIWAVYTMKRLPWRQKQDAQVRVLVFLVTFFMALFAVIHHR